MIQATPLLVEALRRRGTATLGDLAAELDMTVESVSANLGGLHDHGYVTRYGSRADSFAGWDGPDDPYVRWCVSEVTGGGLPYPTAAQMYEGAPYPDTASIHSPQHDKSTFPLSNGDTRG